MRILIILLIFLFINNCSNQKFGSFLKKKNDDRTGLVTVHPELLNKDGFITDEDLLTVRFSKDNDHPKSSEKPSE